MSLLLRIRTGRRGISHAALLHYLGLFCVVRFSPFRRLFYSAAER